MKYLRLLSLLFCFSVFANILAKPLVLIYQEIFEEYTEYDPNLDIMRALSATLEEEGRVSTAIFSNSDPLVIAAIQSGEFKWNVKHTRDDAFRLSRVLGADFVAITQAKTVGGQLNGKLELYYRGRRVYQDESKTSIIRDGALDRESSAMSLARSWTMRLATGAFKDFPAKVDITTPPPGDAPVKPTRILTPDTRPYESGMDALKNGKVMEAIDLLRDAVDVNPLHVEARLGLIEALKRADKPFLAADEALRGYEIAGEDSRLLLTAAECFLSGGKPELAKEYVLRIIEEHPTDATALSLMGDLLLSEMRYQDALDSYTKSLRALPNAETYYKRSQVYALLEEFEKSFADMESAKVAGLSFEPEQVVHRYRNSVRTLDVLFQNLALSLGNVIRESKAFPDTKDLGQRAMAIVRKCRAYADYLDRITSGKSHEKSHARRALAGNLLIQSAQGLQQFLETHDDDIHSDASLLQVEAMREFAAAQQEYLKEFTKPNE